MKKPMNFVTMQNTIDELFPTEKVEKLKVNNELELYINVVLECLIDSGYSESFIKRDFLLATYIATGIA